MDFKEEWNWLNSYQMEAVTDENDACIVNANVGSGKTTVLIAKILYLHYEKKIPLLYFYSFCGLQKCAATLSILNHCLTEFVPFLRRMRKVSKTY